MAQTIETYMLFPNNKCFLYIQLIIVDSTHTHTHIHTNPGF